MGSAGGRVKEQTLKVGPMHYRLVVAGRIAADPGESVIGQVEHDSEVIRLADSQSPRNMAVTLVHELLHAIERQAAMKLKEREIDALAYGLVEVLGDNPWLPALIGEIYGRGFAQAATRQARTHRRQVPAGGARPRAQRAAGQKPHTDRRRGRAR